MDTGTSAIFQPLTPTQNPPWNLSDVVRLNEDTAVTLIPAMLVIGLYMVVGVPGNLLVCYVMGFKLKMNTQNLLIVYLAVFDLLSCLISMPVDIYDMRYLYTYPSEGSCKAFRTITAFTSMASILTLIVIAVDRYWKICRRVKFQMNLHRVKFSLIFVLLGAAIFSFPAIFIFGFRTIDSGIPGFPGHDCSTSDDLKDTLFPLVYISILFLVFIILCVFLIVIYCCILVATKHHRRSMTTRRIPMREDALKQNKHKNSSSGDIFTSKYGSRLQGEITEDPSSSSTHPSTSTNINDNIKDNYEGNNDAVVASSHDKQIQMVGEPDYKGLRVDCDMNNGEGDGECNVHSTGIQNDSSLGKKEDECCGEQNNKKDNDYGLRRVEDEDCQEHSNGKCNDDGLRSAGYEDCQEQSNGKRNNPGLKSVRDEDYQEQSNSKKESCDSDTPNKTICDNSNIHSCCKNTFDTESSNSRTKFMNEKTGEVPNRRHSNDSSFSNREIESSNRLSVEKLKPAASRKKSDEFDAKRKVSCSSLVFVYKETNQARRKSSSVSAKLEHKTTIIAFLVTLVFILSFLPYLILQIIKINLEGFDYKLKGAALVFFNICLRSYHINSLANPFIYGVYNKRFRHEVYLLLSRCYWKCKQKCCHRAEERNM